jgi:hypothetical protein
MLVVNGKGIEEVAADLLGAGQQNAHADRGDEIDASHVYGDVVAVGSGECGKAQFDLAGALVVEVTAQLKGFGMRIEFIDDGILGAT